MLMPHVRLATAPVMAPALSEATNYAHGEVGLGSEGVADPMRADTHHPYPRRTELGSEGARQTFDRGTRDAEAGSLRKRDPSG